MDLLLPAVAKLAEVAFLVALAPLVTAVIKRVKARMQCRRGPGLLQGYHDLIKLFRKGRVISHDASWLFRAVPPVVLAATVTAATLVPVLFARTSAGTTALILGDAFMLAGLLALARFVTALGALDTHGAFGGMGAAREITVSALAEPALALVIFGVAVDYPSTDLATLSAERATHGMSLLTAGNAIGALAALVILVAESGRLPVDNPDTHLELTMLHEGMILEHSGPGLGCLVMAGHLKQGMVMALLMDLFFPFGIAVEMGAAAVAVAILSFAAKAAGMAAVLGLVESSVAKLRFFQVPNLMVGAMALAFVALIVRSQ